jgi:hypothetical protein
MDSLYVAPFKQLATGGSIGDALFFFCSGFTLFLGTVGRFDNWYKRRINRIYPTVFAMAILSAAFFGSQRNMVDVIIHGGGWFVTCIMMYYVVFYFIRKYLINKLNLTFILLFAVCVVWYFFIIRSGNYLIESGREFSANQWITQSYFKWVYFFLFMLLGAMLGMSERKWKYSLKFDFVKLCVCIALWYIILIIGKKIELIADWQIVGLIPLFGTIFYFYKVCNSRFLTKIYNNIYAGAVIKIIGGLCLEIYLIQGALFTTKMNSLFPLNIPIMFLIIFVGAYILRCLSRIFAQTFKEENYHWKAVFKVY